MGTLHKQPTVTDRGIAVSRRKILKEGKKNTGPTVRGRLGGEREERHVTGKFLPNNSGRKNGRKRLANPWVGVKRIPCSKNEVNLNIKKKKT